jgi:hypothetical protein
VHTVSLVLTVEILPVPVIIIIIIIINIFLLRDMVCLSNIFINTLRKGDSVYDDDKIIEGMKVEEIKRELQTGQSNHIEEREE